MSVLTLTAWEAELQRIEDDIASASDSVLEPPIQLENATKYVYRLYQRASLGGDLCELAVAEQAIDHLIPQLQHPDDLLLLKANLAFKVHRLERVEQIFDLHPHLRGTDEGLKLQADLHFQKGGYAEAREAYLHAIQVNRSWDNLARFAHFVSRFEGSERADELYVEAEDELTCKQMRSFAWIELQRGLLDLAGGRYDEAAAHYDKAERAYSGYWMVREHIAGLLGAQGRFSEAIELYRDLVAQVPRPELRQALGDVYVHMGEPEQARPYYDQALTAYTESAARGEVHYYHHLVDFHCGVTKNGTEAVRWARMDLELRNNFSTQSALAWALYLEGNVGEAMEWLDRALSSGVIDAWLFSHAATIYAAAGRNGKSHRYQHRAGNLNRHLRGFHVHHH